MTQEELDALPDVFELSLRKPISLGSITYDHLTFHEPTAGQIEEASRLEGNAAEILLMALSAGVVDGVIRQLGSRDLRKATAFIYSFTQDVEPTGALA